MRLELLESRQLLANDLQIDLQLFDTMNQPISGPVAPGTEIVLEATIRDIRANAVGVASAYLDLTFPGQTSLVAGSVTHGADYNFDPSNGVLNGSTLEDIGAADTDLTPPSAAQAADDYLLFSIHFTADTVGTGNFSVAVGNNALLLTRMFPETGFITVAPDMVVVNGATLEVAAANSVPVANDQTINTNEDTAAGVTLTGTDADSDPLSFTVIAQPANGTLSGHRAESDLHARRQLQRLGQLSRSSPMTARSTRTRPRSASASRQQ
ncbi:MAG: Ig-like domain-containing protein [Pirellulaceae bacterium]